MSQGNVKTRPRWRRLVAGALLSLAFLVVLIAAGLMLLAPTIEESIAATLSERTGQPVELGSFSWSLWPPGFSGDELIVGEADSATNPLYVRVGSFSIRAAPSLLFSEPREIELLRLQDLDVRVRRRPSTPGATEPGDAASKRPVPRLPVTLKRIDAVNVHIEIFGTDSSKPPRLFVLDRLLLDSFDLAGEVRYQARIQYHKPPGDLHVEGSFGPVDFAEPRATPYQGKYRFTQADLGVFGGIAGLLSATGTFQGTVSQTRVQGEAQIPDFQVTRVGNIVPLSNKYTAAVRDNGAIIELLSVETSFGQSTLHTSGSLNRDPSRNGRRVDLQVESDRARVEDLTLFGVSSEEPPLMGLIELETRVVIPPGNNPFIERLRAEGEFQIQEGEFSNIDIQKTLEKLSRFGGGDEALEKGESVVSDMEGDFLLEETRLSFSRLNFSVPGSRFELAGTYQLRGEAMNFKGHVLLERTASEMVTGRLSNWLKILDPLLRRGDAGTVVPITIGGTRSSPRFSVDFKKLGR